MRIVWGIIETLYNRTVDPNSMLEIRLFICQMSMQTNLKPCAKIRLNWMHEWTNANVAFILLMFELNRSIVCLFSAKSVLFCVAHVNRNVKYFDGFLTNTSKMLQKPITHLHKATGLSKQNLIICIGYIVHMTIYFHNIRNAKQPANQPTDHPGKLRMVIYYCALSHICK